MRPSVVAATVVLAIVSGPYPAMVGFPPPAAQPRLVSIEVTVLNGDGTWHSGLGRDDFTVAVDGEPRSIEQFASGERPVTAVVLFDVSASCQINRPGDLKSPVEKRFLAGTAPADRLRFGTVGTGAVVLSPAFASERKTLRSALRVLDLPEVEVSEGPGFAVVAGTVVSVGRGGPTGARMGPSPIWDAVYSAAEVLEREPGRRAIILITDGQATGNMHGLQEAILRAMAAGVTVSTVSLREDRLISLDRTRAARVRPSMTLKDLADGTGGGFFSVSGAASAAPGNARAVAATPVAGTARMLDRIADLMAEALQMAHRTYGISIEAPSPDIQLHRLEVRVKPPGLTVRAPAGLLMRAAGVSR